MQLLNKEFVRAKRIDNREWVEGYYIRYGFTGNEKEYVVPRYASDLYAFEIEPETVCRCSGKEYMDSDIAYEGDIFESQASGDLMILRYGTYQSYCPVDKVYMDSVGFYAECKGYPDMPIGDLHDYALKKGNIFDNFDLIGCCKQNLI